MRAQINNMVIGVTTGFTKLLEIQGTGYRAQADGKKLVLQLGFSHPIVFEPPPGTITIKAEALRRGCQRCRQVPRRARSPPTSAASVRPSPTRARAFKYEGEFIRRKAGKAAGAASHERTAQQVRAAPDPPLSHPEASHGNRGASAPVGVPQLASHLRADHRRHSQGVTLAAASSRDNGREVAGRGARSGQGTGTAVGKAVARPARQGEGHSVRSASIAAATSTMGASRRSPRALAPAVSSSRSTRGAPRRITRRAEVRVSRARDRGEPLRQGGEGRPAILVQRDRRGG